MNLNWLLTVPVVTLFVFGSNALARDTHAKECYDMMERYVAGPSLEKKDWFFQFQEYNYMKDLTNVDSSTKPPTQRRNFNSKVLPGGERQVTMRVFEGSDLGTALKAENIDQSKLDMKDRILKRIEVIHFESSACTDVNNKSCFYKKTTFDMQNPDSGICFKYITSDHQLKSPVTKYSSPFCQKWNAYAQSSKEDGTELKKSFMKQDPNWRKDFPNVEGMPTLNALKAAVSNCSMWTASKNAKWDAEPIRVPSFQVPSPASGATK